MVNTEETCTVCVFQNYICVLKRKKETYVSALCTKTANPLLSIYMNRNMNVDYMNTVTSLKTYLIVPS